MTHETLRRSDTPPILPPSAPPAGIDLRADAAAPTLTWSPLAALAGLSPGEPALLALSGGADSVALVHLAHRAQRLVAVHVDHGLRGADSLADAEFCRELCARLGVPFECVRLDLQADSPNLEQRAREARYVALAEIARSRGLRTVLVAHHADDADETLLLRLLRGTHPSGVAGPTRRAPYPVAEGRGAAGGALEVVRPLLGVRGATLRSWLEGAGHAWREDASNRSPRFTRNRVRHALLPLLERTCGPEARASLRALASELVGVELELARRLPELTWSTHVTFDAPRVARTPLADLRELPAPLYRRALRGALLVRTGAAPADAVLDQLIAARSTGDPLQINLRGGFRLRLGPRELALVAPLAADAAGRGHDWAEPRPLPLDAPLALGGGRALVARRVRRPADAAPPSGEDAVELSLPPGLEDRARRGELVVRAPRPGDRLHPLGAPGHRPLMRFLADAGVPREERARLPLVVLGDEILWVCGLRPSEPWRVRSGEVERLRLELAADPTHR